MLGERWDLVSEWPLWGEVGPCEWPLWGSLALCPQHLPQMGICDFGRGEEGLGHLLPSHCPCAKSSARRTSHGNNQISPSLLRAPKASQIHIRKDCGKCGELCAGEMQRGWRGGWMQISDSVHQSNHQIWPFPPLCRPQSHLGSWPLSYNFSTTAGFKDITFLAPE